MVGFIGEQHLLSGDGLGVSVEETYTSTVLSNGKVASAYLGSSSGLLRVSLYNPKTGETEELFTQGTFALGYKVPTIMAGTKGKFSIIMEEDAETINHNQIVLMNYKANGTQIGEAKVLDSGYLMEMKSAINTKDGFFVAYRDRDPEAELEYVGRFFNEKGKQVSTYNFDEGRGPTEFGRANPVLTEMEDGRFLATWQLGSASSRFGQFFKTNGKPDGDRFEMPHGVEGEDYAADPAIHATKDGGFLAVYSIVGVYPHTADTDLVHIQKYNKNGVAQGKPVTFDSKIDGESVTPNEFAVAETASGLLAVTFTGYRKISIYESDSDVYLSVVSPSGKLVFGPAVIHEDPEIEDQSNAAFHELNNGQFLITLHDSTFKWLSYGDSLQGVDLSEPDYFWEGNGKDNKKSGTDGEDILLGLAGNDDLSGGKKADYIKGGGGDDAVSGGGGSDLLYGEAGDDALSGDAGNDTLYGGQDNDTLRGGGGGDFLYGGDGNDKLLGNGGGDQLFGGEGKDRLTGGGGGDTLFGGNERDVLLGGGGSDAMNGEDGNDVLKAGNGDDYIYGGEGKDKIFGGGGNDFVQGGEGNDKVYGDAGNDNIYSGGGNDKEYGGAGNDTIYDSDGNDRLFGGDGADSFVFQDSDFGKDKILDFEFGTDVLDMSITAQNLKTAGAPDIKIIDNDKGVLFKVDGDHSVLVVGADLSDFKDGDYITDSLF